MKKIFAILMILLLSAGLAACSGTDDTPEPTVTPEATATPEPEETPEPNDTDAALFEGNGWSMEMADGWSVMDVAGFTFLVSPGGDGSNINVVSESMQGLDADGYVNASLDMLEAMFEDLELITRETISISENKDAVLLIYTSAFPGVNRTYQFFLELDDTAFIITYTRMDDTDYFDDVLGMLETFVFR